MVYIIYTMEHYLVIEKNELFPFATTWMDREVLTMLSEMSYTESQTLLLSLIAGIQKIKQMDEYFKKLSCKELPKF